MTDYIKLFNTTTEYYNYKNSQDFNKPNVSYIENDKCVMVTPNSKTTNKAPILDVELDNITTGIVDRYGNNLRSTGSILTNATFNSVSCCQMQRYGSAYIYDIGAKYLYPLTIVFNIARISINGHGKIFTVCREFSLDKSVEEGASCISGNNRLIVGYGLPGFNYAGSWYDAINNNQWYNVIHVVDGTNVKNYLDGVLKQDRTLTSSVNNTLVVGFGIGYPYANNNQMVGYIRKFRVYDYAVDDIQTLYNETKVV